MMPRLFTALGVVTVAMALSYAPASLARDTHVATITIKEKVIKAKDCTTQADEKELKRGRTQEVPGGM